jgi:hypothetical protein
MDCTNARALLLFARPAEESGQGNEFDLLQGHLEQCGECRELAHHDNRVDHALGAAIRNVPIPAGLDSRILDRLERQRPRRVWPRLAVAASLLMAVSLSVWAYYPPPLLESNSKPFDTIGASVTAVEVTDWLREEGFDVEAPSVIDFVYYDSFGMVSIKGRKVPHVLFVNPTNGAVAHVYVISKRKFRWDDDFAESVKGGSRSAEIHQAPDNPKIFFLVIYSTGSRESFPRRGVT